MAETRPPIPQDITDIMNAWFHWRSFWNTIHYLLGFLSAVISALVSINLKTKILFDDRGCPADC
jgi:hypothetical protein